MAIRVVVQQVPPLRAAAARFLLASLALIVVAVARRLRWPQGRRQWRALLVLGASMMALPYGLLFWAERWINSSLTAVLFSSLPLFVALFTPFMLHQQVPRRAVYGMVWAVGGIAVLFYSGLSLFSYMIAGGLAVIAAVAISAWSSIFAKRELRGVDPFTGSAVQFAVAALLLFAASSVLERGLPASWSMEGVLALVFLAIFGSGVAFSLYYWLLRHLLPYQISAINLVVPLVAIMEGAWILHESVPPLMVVSSLVVIAAVGAVLRSEDEGPPGLGLNT